MEGPARFIDCRRVSLSSYGANFRGFVEELSRALNEFISSCRGRVGKLLDYLRGVRGVEVNDRNFSDLLKRLVKAGLVEKGGRRTRSRTR